MKSIYSIVRYINNPLSKENIAFGLIAICDGVISYKFSEEKINFISKLNPSVDKLINFSLEKIKESLSIGTDNSTLLIKKDILFSKEYLERLSVYNNGVIQFDKPSLIELSLKDKTFEDFFLRYISLNTMPKKKINMVDELHTYIKSNFYKPLENSIDVDYELKKKEVPSLFFDYHLDGLGINGAIFSAKAINLNSGRQLNQINKDISEFESVNQRLNEFSKSKGYSEVGSHYLIVDEYKGNKISYMDLYSILKEENHSFFKLVNSSELSNVVKQIQDNHVRKFSLEFQDK